MSACECLNGFDVAELRDLYSPDHERIRVAGNRQKAVWEGKKPDAWPIMMSAPLTREQERIPAPDFKEAFDNDEMMLCGQVRAACGVINAGSDAVPSIRANLGTGICLSLLGLEQEVFPEKMPWLKQHLTLEQAAALTPDDIRIQGDFDRGLRQMALFRKVMNDAIPVYCMDTQGPFDLAHLMVGDELFYAIHDDPGLVHHIMNLALQIGIKAHTWMKERAGEPLDRINHGNTLYAENMGIRICEDTTVLLSPEAMAEFALPYTQKLAAHFGGAWVHYCGRHDGLTRGILELPEIRGINFGHIPGHLYDHVFEEDMQLIREHGKVYYGSWPRLPGETGRDFLKRMHEWAAQGAMIPFGHEAVNEPDGFTDVRTALDYWYSL